MISLNGYFYSKILITNEQYQVTEQVITNFVHIFLLTVLNYHIIMGSCLLQVMSTTTSTVTSVDTAVNTRSILDRHSVDCRSTFNRDAVDTQSIVGQQSVDSWSRCMSADIAFRVTNTSPILDRYLTNTRHNQHKSLLTGQCMRQIDCNTQFFSFLALKLMVTWYSCNLTIILCNLEGLCFFENYLQGLLI